MKYIKEREKSGREGRRCLTFGSWNVHSLVERSGGVATASVSGRVAEDKTCRRVAAELRRLNVAATGLQETHWFGTDIYVADGFTILCSGRPYLAMELRATDEEKESPWHSINLQPTHGRMVVRSGGLWALVLSLHVSNSPRVWRSCMCDGNQCVCSDLCSSARQQKSVLRTVAGGKYWRS